MFSQVRKRLPLKPETIQNKTQWNKRQGHSGHKSYGIVMPIGVILMLTYIFAFGGQYT